MTKAKSMLHKIAKYFNPIDTAKWYANKIRQHKFMFIIVLIISVYQTAYCVNFQPLADFFTDGGFIMDTTMTELRVDLTAGAASVDAEAIYGVLATAGQSLAILIWIIGMGELSMRSDLTPELIIRDFIKIIITILIIGDYGYDIITGIMNICNEIFDLIEGVVGNTAPATTTTAGQFTSVPLGKMGSVLLALVLLDGLKIFVNLSIAVVVWERKIKLILYAAVAPLGLFDFRDGFHSPAANYIRRFAALCLQGVIILVTNSIVSDIIVANIVSLMNIGGSVFDSLKTFAAIAPIMIVMITFMKSTEQIAGDVVGAR